jgi:hypothetical protein
MMHDMSAAYLLRTFTEVLDPATALRRYLASQQEPTLVELRTAFEAAFDQALHDHRLILLEGGFCDCPPPTKTDRPRIPWQLQM